jgi:hypothetical protein
VRLGRSWDEPPPRLGFVPGRVSIEAIDHLIRKVPGLRRLPAATLIEIGEIILLAREHLARLEPHERRRVVQLMRIGRGRPSKLTLAQRDELMALVAKAEPRLFFGLAAKKLSPVPLPRRVVYGRSARRRRRS